MLLNFSSSIDLVKKMGDSMLVDSYDLRWSLGCLQWTCTWKTGEVVSDEYEISREQMDEFAARSQRLASQAQENGWFDWEKIPMEIPQRRGDPVMFDTDEGIRDGTTAEGLSKLRAVFKKDGRVTAGNASTLNDGASAILVADYETAVENGWEIIATIEDYCTSGLEPERVMAAPIPAIKTLLTRNNLDVLDVDVYEHNEAFCCCFMCSSKGRSGIRRSFQPSRGLSVWVTFGC